MGIFGAAGVQTVSGHCMEILGKILPKQEMCDIVKTDLPEAGKGGDKNACGVEEGYGCT